MCACIIRLVAQYVFVAIVACFDSPHELLHRHALAAACCAGVRCCALAVATCWLKCKSSYLLTRTIGTMLKSSNVFSLGSRLMANDQGCDPVGLSSKEAVSPALARNQLDVGRNTRCSKRRAERRLHGAAARAANGLQVRLPPPVLPRPSVSADGVTSTADRQPASLPATARRRHSPVGRRRLPGPPLLPTSHQLTGCMSQLLVNCSARLSCCS